MTINTEQDYWWRFLQACKSINNEKQLNEFFDLFLTYEERRSVADRYRIVKELIKDKKTQREIAAESSISIASITRGSNSLKIISSKLRKFLERRIKNDGS